ncbi:MAG: site-specific integrase [Deltaproteobacteria bacterium HGW-Deltaproteobacteria-15]|jgi:integrase|nr:MAG: site-specific integrase [Deltaproteobacteria bacterium HGW-Deltaproteobacteria-15]
MEYPIGCIYKRAKSPFWWAKIVPYKGGKPVFESTKRTRQDHAETWLKDRMKDFRVDLGHVRPEQVTFDELAKDLKTEYGIEGRKSLDRLENSIGHLEKVFTGMRAMEINTARVKRYIELRQSEGAQNGTINRELAALSKMFSLGAQNTPRKVLTIPHIPKLKEANPRKGFFEPAEYQAVLSQLPGFYRGPVTFAYYTGWRQGEVLDLKWSNVDREGGMVTLDVGTTKNDEGRTVYMTEELRTLLEAQWEERKASGKLSPYVFPNESRTNRILKTRFNRAWRKACEKAGHTEKLFHDLRRTAVRNMVRAGIPERVAMMISGHKTRSIFDRYNIVDDKDLRQAAQKIEAYHGAQVTPAVTPKVRSLSEGNRKGINHAS